MEPSRKCPYCQQTRVYNAQGLLMATCGGDACRRKQARDRKRKQRGSLPAVTTTHDGPLSTPWGGFESARAAWFAGYDQTRDDLDNNQRAALIGWLGDQYAADEPDVHDLWTTQVGSCPQEIYGCPKCAAGDLGPLSWADLDNDVS